MVTEVKDGLSRRKNGNGKKGGLLDRGRSLVKKTKTRVFEVALGEALGVLGHTSEEHYSRIAQLFKAQAKDPGQKLVAEFVEQYFSPTGQGRQYVKRVLSQIDPNVRRNYLARFITNLVFHQIDVHYTADGREVTSPACVVLSPTMRCNLRCHGCYAGNYTKKDDLPQDVLERVIGEARELGVHFYIVSGGEPLIYEPLFDVFKKFNDCAFQFYTSGHLIDEQKAKKIVELGNVVPAISIEGFKEQTELRRGPNGFDRVMRAMDILREAHALFAFSVTVTRLNYDEVTSDAFIDLMIEKGAGYGWYFTYIPIGRNPDLSLMPTPEQRDGLRKFINRTRETKPMLMGDFWNDGPLSEGCLSGGRRYLHINNKGDVEPCVFIHFADRD
ncbi:MAG: radical SAM protein, partial [Chloroflexi bacterium]|nr:radical SAM protein [Chloroflexota bacterium]